MNRLFFCVAVLGLLVFTSPALAQKGGEKPGERGDRGSRKEGGRGGAGQRNSDRGKDKNRGAKGGSDLQAIGDAMNSELNLSKEQVTEIKKLFKEHIEKQREEHQKGKKSENEETRKQMADLKEKAQEARKSGDQSKSEALMEQLKELREQAEDANPVMDDALAKAIVKVLDDKQKEKFWQIVERYEQGGGHGGSAQDFRAALKNLTLSDAQNKAIEKLFKDFEAATGKAGDKGDPKKSKDMLSKLRNDIMDQLDETQQKAFRASMKDKDDGDRGGRAERGSEHGGNEDDRAKAKSPRGGEKPPAKRG